MCAIINAIAEFLLVSGLWQIRGLTDIVVGFGRILGCTDL